MDIIVRHSEPEDYKALYRIFSGPKAVAGNEKFGFEVEGTHRRLAFRDGEYVDAYSMALLKA